MSVSIACLTLFLTGGCVPSAPGKSENRGGGKGINPGVAGAKPPQNLLFTTRRLVIATASLVRQLRIARDDVAVVEQAISIEPIAAVSPSNLPQSSTGRLEVRKVLVERCKLRFVTKKSSAASELARARWKKTTKAERSEIARQLNVSRWKDTTPEERSEAARKAVAARWGKAKKKTKP